MSGWDCLTSAQSEVARRVIAEESAKREHVVVYLSGAHAYGFPSPDSDLDLKCIHVAPTASLLGLRERVPTAERTGFLGEVEIDYTSNELAGALQGILQGNGNFLERVLGAAVLQASGLVETLRPLVKASLSRRVHRHYRGFAMSQWKAFESGPTVKKMLYVLRTALTGTHLLRTGELLTDLGLLADDDGFEGARELIALKRAGENVAPDEATMVRWRGELQRAMTVLDEAEPASCLPTEPPNEAELEAWLVEARRARL